MHSLYINCIYSGKSQRDLESHFQEGFEYIYILHHLEVTIQEDAEKIHPLRT